MLKKLIANWFGKRRVERELDDELRFHLEVRVEELRAQGVPPAEARRRAQLELGGAEQIREDVREVRVGASLESIWQDIRYGARMLRRSPGFTMVAVLTLALGIGANTALFSVVHAVLLRPLPFHDPDRLALVWTTFQLQNSARGDTTGPDFLEWREQNRSFEQLAGFSLNPVTITGVDEPQRAVAFLVTPNLFATLGARAMHGRLFLPEEARLGGPRVALVSYGAWQRRFGSDPQVAGKSITLNGNAYQVVGVMPPEFRFPSERAEFWLPMPMDHAVWQVRGEHFLTVVGRLKPGVSVEAAEADMNRIADALREQYRQNRFRSVAVSPMKDDLVSDVEATLWTLFGAVGLVTLIACANVANLMMSRSIARQREMAVRVALGAGRVRLLRQLLTEGILVATLGGAAGLFLSRWGVDALLALSATSLPRQQEIGINLYVLLFTLGLSVLTGLVFAAAPALAALRQDVRASLNEAAPLAGTRSRTRFRHLLVSAEIGLSLVLVTGSGLMLTSVYRLLHVDPGFQPERLLSFQLSFPRSRYPENAQHIEFAGNLIEKLSSIPGARSAALVSHLPLDGDFWRYGLTFPGRPPLPEGARKAMAAYRLVSESYFPTMGMPLLRGRSFNERDHAAAPRVLVINQTMARRYFPGSDPVGQRVEFGFCRPDPCEIVGVVGDIKHFGLDADEDPAMYGSWRQKPDAGMNQAFFVVRSAGDAAGLAGAAKSAVWSLDADLPVNSITTLEEKLSASLGSRWLVTLLLTIFAALAVTLAMVGVYGVMAYSTSQRAHEFGLRMALGATPADILRLVLGQGLAVTAAGVAIGVAGALSATWLLSAYLFGVTSTDPLTFAGVAVLLTLVALGACYVPARRATRVDPMTALRYE